jgi:hypothetical protein
LPLAYNSVSDKGAVVMDNKKRVTLTVEQEKEFTKAFKIGILKGLYKKQLLNDEQLKKLIAMQK